MPLLPLASLPAMLLSVIPHDLAPSWIGKDADGNSTLGNAASILGFVASMFSLFVTFLVKRQVGRIEAEYILRTQSGTWIEQVNDHANIADSHFVIYEGRYRTCDPDENLYWASSLVLKLIDEEGITLWTFPSNVSGLYDLFQAVQPQASDLESRLDKILEFNV